MGVKIQLLEAGAYRSDARASQMTDTGLGIQCDCCWNFMLFSIDS